LKPTASIQSRTRLKNNLGGRFLAGHTADHDMGSMKQSSILLGLVLGALMAVSTASAQLIPPGGSQFNPPPPPPPPPPKIEVPVIPKMGESLPVPQVKGLRRDPFGDRISKCLEDAAAAGIRPSERSAYSRACANQ
jgi:hypothetical protein